MKKVIFMLAAAAVMASCTKTEIFENNPTGANITAQSKHQPVSGEVTRAPFMGSIQTGNELNTRVLTFDDAGGIYANGVMNFASAGASTPYTSVTTGTGTEKYPSPAPTANYSLLGLYPATGWTASLPALTSSAVIPFDGSVDVMVAEIQEVTPTEMENGTAPLLTFEHQLTKFEVKIKAKDAEGEGAWDKVNSIKLTAIKQYANLPNSFSYKLDGTDTQYTGTATGGINFFAIDNSGAAPDYKNTTYAGVSGSILFPAGNPVATSAYTMVAPFTPTNNDDVTIRVIAYDGTQDRTFDINVSVPAPPTGATSTAGYSYTISLTFADAMTIIAEAQVSDWLDGGETDHTIN